MSTVQQELDVADKVSIFELQHQVAISTFAVLAVFTAFGAVLNNLMLGFAVGLGVAIWRIIANFTREARYVIDHQHG